MARSAWRGIARAMASGAAAGCLASGCAPSTDLLGAEFPGWMICIVAGVVLAVAVYLALARVDDTYRPAMPALTYPTFATLFALLTWLIFFRQ